MIEIKAEKVTLDEVQKIASPDSGIVPVFDRPMIIEVPQDGVKITLPPGLDNGIKINFEDKDRR